MAEIDASFSSGAALNAASGNLSGNKIAPSAKAAVVDASGITFNFNNGEKNRREPFMMAKLRACLETKARGRYVDSAIEQIAKVQRSDMDSAAKNVCIYILEKNLAHQLNLGDIIDKAIASPDLNEGVDPGNLDPEWAEKFEEYAGSKYNDEAQDIWAKLLTGELNNPGSYSRKAMSILDDMEREDAEAFSALCARCAGGVLPWGERQQLLPLLIEKDQELELPHDVFARLKDLGLIRFDFSEGSITTCKTIGDGDWETLMVGSRPLSVRFPEGKSFGYYVHGFTSYGEELSRLCDVGSELERDDLLINKFRQTGGEVVPAAGPLSRG